MPFKPVYIILRRTAFYVGLHPFFVFLGLAKVLKICTEFV